MHFPSDASFSWKRTADIYKAEFCDENECVEDVGSPETLAELLPLVSFALRHIQRVEQRMTALEFKASDLSYRINTVLSDLDAHNCGTSNGVAGLNVSTDGAQPTWIAWKRLHRSVDRVHGFIDRAECQVAQVKERTSRIARRCVDIYTAHRWRFLRNSPASPKTQEPASVAADIGRRYGATIM